MPPKTGNSPLKSKPIPEKPDHPHTVFLRRTPLRPFCDFSSVVHILGATGVSVLPPVHCSCLAIAERTWELAGEGNSHLPSLCEGLWPLRHWARGRCPTFLICAAGSGPTTRPDPKLRLDPSLQDPPVLPLVTTFSRGRVGQDGSESSRARSPVAPAFALAHAAQPRSGLCEMLSALPRPCLYPHPSD